MTDPAHPGAPPAAEFYSKRTEELRAASDDSALHYSRCTQVLVALAIVGCIAFYQAIVPKRLPVWKAGPGTILVREWQGSAHRVTVLGDGVSFNGKRYRSLSEVAREITGSRWSGPRFFGLRTSALENHHGTL